MIIEAAINIAPLVLTQKESYQGIREEDFSNLLSDCCRMVLSGVDLRRGLVNVEVYYHNSFLRCDLVIDDTRLPFPYPELSHKEYVECKYFRLGTGTPFANCKTIWQDFRKVLAGRNFAYSVILCEVDYLHHLNTGIPAHDGCVNQCFNLKYPSYFSLWEKRNFDPANDDPFTLINDGSSKELQIKRLYTSAFPIKFEKDTRIYRIYLFNLYSKDIVYPQFEF